MEGQHEGFVSGPLAGVLWISKFAAAAPLRFMRQGNGWGISLSRKCCIVVLPTVTGICCLIVMTLINTFHGGLKGTHNVWPAVIVVSGLLAATVVYGAPRRMRCLITCLNQLKKIRSELNTQHKPLWTRKQAAKIMSWAVVSVTINVIEFVLLTFYNNIFPVLSLPSFLSTLQSGIDCMNLLGRAQFALLALYVQTCFQSVNDSLRNLLADVKQKKRYVETSPYKAKNTYKRVDKKFKFRKIDFGVERPRPPYETVRRLYSAYARSCDVVRAVDRMYGSILVLQLSLFLMHLITKSYYLIMNIMDGYATFNDTSFVILEFTHFCSCLNHVLNLVMIIEPCDMTHAELDDTRNLVGHLMLYTRSLHDPLEVELEQFHRHINLNEVAYRPLYITTMTRGLVLSTLGNITTYLVILINI